MKISFAASRPDGDYALVLPSVGKQATSIASAVVLERQRFDGEAGGVAELFLDAEGPEVVGWAERVSRLGRPLLVGAVPANGAPDLVRAAATSALQSAYEREVVCVVAA